MATASSTAPPKVRSPAGTCGAPPLKTTRLRTIVKMNRAAMTTTLILLRFFSPMTIHTAMKAPMMRLHQDTPMAAMVLAAKAALATMTAVQPTSWMTFRPAKSLAPWVPKEMRTVSMALPPVRPPMRPARYMTTPPMRWPRMIAAKALAKPSGARSIPVRISAMEMPAPNHNRPLEKTDVLCSFIIKYQPFFYNATSV